MREWERLTSGQRLNLQELTAAVKGVGRIWWYNAAIFGEATPYYLSREAALAANEHRHDFDPAGIASICMGAELLCSHWGATPRGNWSIWSDGRVCDFAVEHSIPCTLPSAAIEFITCVTTSSSNLKLARFFSILRDATFFRYLDNPDLDPDNILGGAEIEFWTLQLAGLEPLQIWINTNVSDTAVIGFYFHAYETVQAAIQANRPTL
jgi:hypothetical protein